MVENELGEGADDGFAGVGVLCYGGAEGVVEKVLGRYWTNLNEFLLLINLRGRKFCCRHYCCERHERERILDMYDE